MMVASASHGDDGAVGDQGSSRPASGLSRSTHIRRSSLPAPAKTQTSPPRLAHSRSRSLIEPAMLGAGGDIGTRGLDGDDEEEERRPLAAKGKGKAVEPNGHAGEEDDEPEAEVDEEQVEQEEQRIQEVRLPPRLLSVADLWRHQHLRRLAAREQSRRRAARQSATFVLLPSTPELDIPSLGNGLTTIGRRGSQLARRGSKLIRQGSVRAEERRRAHRIRDGSGEGSNSLGGRPYEDLEEAEEVEMQDSPRTDIYDAVRITSPTTEGPTEAPERPAMAPREASFRTFASEPLTKVDSEPNWKLIHPQRTRDVDIDVDERVIAPPRRLGFFDWCLCGCWLPDEDDRQAGQTMPDTIPADD